jgi:hypothetical protein
MPPKEMTELDALSALAAQDTEGPRDRRIESVCDETMNQAIIAVTAELGSRSKAVRQLIKEGAKARAARLARRSARA